ncbi:hypothetical protein GBA52_015521 [Prunus armeniaca]|nr:hypothetical protein GBA52_015521 [Prunus armeniaca]
MLSKKASCDSHGQDSSYFLGWQEYEKNPYDPVQNPNGIIQMGLAENQLSFDLVESWLASNPDALELKRNGGSVFRELALFQDYHGFPAFKNELVEFMAEMRGNRVKFDPNKLVLTAGSTSANETLMFCLAEPGEAFLLPTPYYPGNVLKALQFGLDCSSCSTGKRQPRETAVDMTQLGGSAALLVPG